MLIETAIELPLCTNLRSLSPVLTARRLSGRLRGTASPPRHGNLRPRPRLRRVIDAVVRSMRPRQWTKNLLVVAAPLAAGTLFDTPVWWQTLVAFVAFCALSGAVYLVNDVADVESDRAHPRKRLRPIAAGDLSMRTALTVAIVLGVAVIAVGTAVDQNLGLLLLSYAVLQVAYS